MELLSVEDFKDTKFDPNWSPFDGQEKVKKQNFKIRSEKEKKKHDLDLKYFLYNAPLPEAMCKEENMSFK